MLDPLESTFEGLMQLHGIRYTRPEQEQGGKGPHGSFDFYLPDFNLLVEVKAWSCERLLRQLKDRNCAMVLIGMRGVLAFGNLLQRTGGEEQQLTKPELPYTWPDCTCLSDPLGRCVIPAHQPEAQQL